MATPSDYLSSAVSALYNELRGTRFRTLKPEQAFIKWYARARYGEESPCRITDGAGDGGIDAIVEEHRVKVVIQAKYEPSKKLRAASVRDIGAFENLARLIRDEEAEDDFDRWIKTVRSELHAAYRALRRAALSDPNSVRFDFVTSKRITSSLATGLDAVDVERIAPLWYLYEEGFTPPTESIELEFEDLWNKGGSRDAVRNYVGIADVRAFLDLMAHDEHERLFAQNVRTDLKTKLNGYIRKTYESNPDEFWMGNNGIYVVCSKATRSGDSLKLVYPSIINGSQTLHSIYHSTVRHPCRVLVRVLELDLVSNRNMLAAIIKRTNSQNPMKPMNLAAHDREQLNIARYLDRSMLFYERREGEWKNEKKLLLSGYQSVRMKELAQWVAVTEGGVGIGSARAKVKELFAEEQYKRLFDRFSDDLSSQAYRKLSNAVASGLLVKSWVASIAASSRGDARIAQLLLVKAVYQAMELSETLATDGSRILRERLFRGGNDPALSRELRGILRSAVAEQKRHSGAKAEGLDLSNYFKRDTLSAVAFEKSATALTLKRLRVALEGAFARE